MSDKPFFWPVTESKIRADDLPQQAITDFGQHQAALEEVARLKAILAECSDALETAIGMIGKISDADYLLLASFVSKARSAL